MVVVACVSLYAAQAIYAIAEWRPLFADGAEFFIRLLENQAFHSPNTPHRLLAGVVTQSPLMAALHFGITDLAFLRTLFGLGLYLPYFVCLAVWLHVTHDRRELMAFPLLFLFASAANSEFFIISQSHAAAAMFFSLLPLMLLKPRWGMRTTVLAAFISFFMLLAYPTMILYGPILVVIAIWRARSAGAGFARTGWIVAAAWYLAGAAIAARDVLWPEATGLTPDGFLEHTVTLLLRHVFGPLSGSGLNLHFGVVVSLAGLALAALAGLAPERYRKLVLVAVTCFALASFATLIALALFPNRLEVPLHYKARVLQLFVPPALALVLMVMTWKGWTLQRSRLGAVMSVVLVLGLFQIGWHLLATHQWAGYLRVFRAELAAREGFVEVQDSALAERRSCRQAIETFNWGWSLPHMSILLAPGGEVRTLIGNPENILTFNPMDPTELPQLDAYGVDYSNYLQSLEAHPHITDDLESQ